MSTASYLSSTDELSADHDPVGIERLNLALSAARMGTWDWNVLAGTIEWDEQMRGLFGLKDGEFSGQNEEFLQLVHPADRERVTVQLSEAIAHCADYDDEFRVVWPGDDSVHTIRARAKVYSNEFGAAVHAIGVAWDTTERRKTEQALEKKRSYFAALMDNIPDHIYFKDTESRITAVNRAMVDWVGAGSYDDLVGHTDMDLFTSEHAEQAMRDEQEIIHTGVPIINLEEKETWADGHETWVSTTKMPLRDVSDPEKIIGTFGVSRDITEKKRAQEELRRVAEELRAKNAALEEDLAMARELQTALLPRQIPCFPRNATSTSISRAQFFHFYQPSAAVSGDFFDVFEIDENRAGLFICDVMGHGTRAALVAAILRTLVRELSEDWNDPGRFLTHLNKALRSALRHTEDPVFASAFYLVADMSQHQLRFSNAAHPRPMHVPLGAHLQGHSRPAPLNGVKPGPALGLFDEITYETGHAELTAHDLIVMFTDGLFEVEGNDGEFYDYGKLASAVGSRTDLSTPDLCQGVVKEIQAFSGHKEFDDDVCLVAMEIEPRKRKISE